MTVLVDFSRLLIRRYAEIYDSTFVVDSNTGDTTFSRVLRQSANVDNLPKSLITTWDQNVWKNFTVAGGFEYWYGSPKLIALRWGYFYESPDNGNRKFMTFGAGIRYSIFGFDFSYLSTIEENHPLGETLRFTLMVRGE